jgi:hypothetical protein
MASRMPSTMPLATRSFTAPPQEAQRKSGWIIKIRRKNNTKRAVGIASSKRRVMARARRPTERNQTLPPTTAAKAARIKNHGGMLNDATLRWAPKEKKK